MLPLLLEAVVPPGWVSRDIFLAGDGATQAVPGPLTTFAAYLGAIMKPEPNGMAGAVHMANGQPCTNRQRCCIQ